MKLLLIRKLPDEEEEEEPFVTIRFFVDLGRARGRVRSASRGWAPAHPDPLRSHGRCGGRALPLGVGCRASRSMPCGKASARRGAAAGPRGAGVMPRTACGLVAAAESDRRNRGPNRNDASRANIQPSEHGTGK